MAIVVGGGCCALSSFPVRSQRVSTLVALCAPRLPASRIQATIVTSVAISGTSATAISGKTKPSTGTPSTSSPNAAYSSSVANVHVCTIGDVYAHVGEAPYMVAPIETRLMPPMSAISTSTLSHRCGGGAISEGSSGSSSKARWASRNAYKAAESTPSTPATSRKPAKGRSHGTAKLSIDVAMSAPWKLSKNRTARTALQARGAEGEDDITCLE